MLVLTQSASALLAAALGALTLSGHVTIGMVLAVAGALGVVNAFDMPGRQSFVVEMVGREDLPNAIALNSSTVNAARMVGPAVAGVLVARSARAGASSLNAASFAAVILALLAMRVPPRADAGGAAGRAAGDPARRSASCARTRRCASCCCCSAWSASWACRSRC